MASREPGGYAVTPSLGGRDLHPHRDISCQGSTPLPSIPQSELVSEERIARTDSYKNEPLFLQCLFKEGFRTFT